MGRKKKASSLARKSKKVQINVQKRKSDAPTTISSPVSSQRSNKLMKKRQQSSQIRTNESNEETSERLEGVRTRAACRRAEESMSERNQRLESMRTRATSSRAEESMSERNQRLESMRTRATSSRAEESMSERIQRLESMKTRATSSRAEESMSERNQRLESMRTRATSSRAEESMSERNQRLESMRKRATVSRAEESMSERNQRLESMRARDTFSRAGESMVYRAQRLEKKKIGASQSRASESQLEREVRQLSDKVRKAQIRLAKGQKPLEGIATNLNLDTFEESNLPSNSTNSCFGQLQLQERRCQHCNAYKFPRESAGFCCRGGRLTSMTCAPEPSPDLKELFVGCKAEELLRNIRQYNSALCMVSTGFKESSISGWHPTVTIEGQMYHLIGALLSAQDKPPAFAQIFFHDSSTELERRMNIFQNLDRGVMSILQEVLHKHNNYIKSFKQAIEILKSKKPEPVQIVLHADKKPHGAHDRTYNIPDTSEIAAIATDEGHKRDIVLHLRDDSATPQLCSIDHTHRSYDPLAYVIPFFDGTDGWSCSLTSQGKKVTELEFYQYRFQVRDGSFNLLMRCQKLMQMYAVDICHGIEASRLHWVKTHQKELRAEKYIGLMDAISADDEVHAGHKLILPSSFYGSPRWYHEQFQDSMAIIRKFGKPDFFITMTTNPNWPEIKESLFPGEQPHDRPDLCVRVFREKMEMLLDDILKNNILGKVVAYVYSKEDQKRGLPHIHLLLIMSDQDKCRSPEDIDNRISAEFPDMNRNPELFRIIARHNIHGPCGVFNKDSPCMSHDRLTCTKSYPKDPQEHTIMGDDSFPRYRRRLPTQGGFTHDLWVKGTHITVDNTWVVPYSPFLSLKYNCHINVEEVATVAAVKYLFKYITKGSDRIIVTLRNGERKDITNDEPERYVNARWLSATYAFWRIYKFSIIEKSPVVEKLPLHLEQEQMVYFAEGNERAAVEGGPPNTKLLGWFQLNTEDEQAASLLYPDIPRFYTWNIKENRQTGRKGFWQRRKKGKPLQGSDLLEADIIGRIPTITLSPHQSELWHLRLMLYNRPGATSYANLKTVDGTVHPTFQSACLALGILENDNEKDQVMVEAATISFGNRLRHVFATLLIYCKPADPLAFWERHRDSLAEDFKRMAGNSAPMDWCYEQALEEISQYLEEEGLSLAMFQLPSPQTVTGPRAYREVTDEQGYDQAEEMNLATVARAKFNSDQLNAFEAITLSISKGEPKLFDLDAPGGTGKTFLLNALLSWTRGQGKIALAVAGSGVAATLLKGGRTVHSRFKVPLLIHPESMCSITRRDAQGQLIQMCSLILWDECFMHNRWVAEAIDRTCQDIRQDPRPFGGITVVFAGDRRQILPVIPHGGRCEIVEASLSRSTLLTTSIKLLLRENMRVKTSGSSKESGAFADVLLAIGDGRYPQNDKGQVQLPQELLLPGNQGFSNLCHEIFGILSKQEPATLCSRAIITSTNLTVEKINDYMIKKLPGQEKLYKSFDTVEREDYNYPTEFLNTLMPSGMPPHILKLKVGAPIVLLRNLDPRNGHCNGSKYIISNLLPNVIEAITMTPGLHINKKLLIPRIPLCPVGNIFPFSMTRKQFPVRLAFAITANKAQGQTLQKVGLYLDKPFFSHGQLYVAMSRVGNPHSLKIAIEGNSNGETSNVVYKEIFQ